MNPTEPHFLLIAYSEIVFLTLLGFAVGYTIVLDASPAARTSVLMIWAFFFALLFGIMSYKTPRLLIFLFQIKPYFLLMMGIVFGFYFNRYNERVAGKKRAVGKMMLTYFASIAGLIFLNILTYSTALLLIYLRSS